MSVFFGTPFWWPKGGARASQGGRFEARFHTFGVPCRVPLFGIDFRLILGCPREGKSCVFYVRVIKNRCSAFPENVLKITSKMVPFWHQMADFGGIQKSIKKCTPKVWHMVPKGCPNGVTFGANSRANSRKKAGPYF